MRILKLGEYLLMKFYRTVWSIIWGFSMKGTKMRMIWMMTTTMMMTTKKKAQNPNQNQNPRAKQRKEKVEMQPLKNQNATNNDSPMYL